MSHVADRIPLRGPAASPHRRGFTLVEVTVVALVMGILAAMAAPAYRRSMEQTRADFAVANLRTIWAAERLYYLEHRTYTLDLGALAALGVLDANLLMADTRYLYLIDSSNGKPADQGFVAKAARSGSAVYAGTLAIDQDGVVDGEIAGTDGYTIRAGIR